MYRSARTTARYLLAGGMLAFALLALFRIYPAPASPELLSRRLGSIQPRELLTLLLGYSYRMSVFVALSELLTAFLLLRARTALAGAVIAVFILSNVIAMGFFFSVPHWYVGILFLLLALLMMGPEAGRMYRLHISRASIAASCFATPLSEPLVEPAQAVSTKARTFLEGLALRTLFAYALCYTLFSEPIGWIFQSWNYVQSLFAAFVAMRLWPLVTLHRAPPLEQLTDNFWHIGAYGSLILAPIVGVIWSAVDYRRTDFRTLYRWLRTLVRYVTASMMFDYAFIKFTGAQVWPPTIAEMTRTAGELMPPSRLFFGALSYSYGYMVFSGLGELTGGLLLLSRRTATLGALILVPLTLNVTLFNIFYDIGVEDRSAPLLLFALIILAGDARRLYAVYVKNQALPAEPLEPPIFDGPTRWIAKLLVLSTFATRLHAHLTGTAPMAPEKAVAMQGSYWVDSFAINGKDRAPFAGDTVRWLRVDIEPSGRMIIERMDGSDRVFPVATDSATAQIVVGTGSAAVNGAARDRAPTPLGPTAVGQLTVTPLGSDRFRIAGEIDNDSFEVVTHRLRMAQFPLMRGKHE